MNPLLLAALGAVVLIVVPFWFMRKPADASQEKVARQAVASSRAGRTVPRRSDPLNYLGAILACSSIGTRSVSLGSLRE